MTIAFMGIDLAKNAFQLHGVDADGNAVFKKRVRRDGLLVALADMLPAGLGLRPVQARSGGNASSKLSAIQPK